MRWAAIGLAVSGTILVMFGLFSRGHKDEDIGSAWNDAEPELIETDEEVTDDSVASSNSTHVQRQIQHKSMTETEAVETMTHLLAETFRSSFTVSKLMDELERRNMKPVAETAVNGPTVIRTENPFPGTRYFEAVFDEDPETSQVFLSSISFEIRPGPKALETAKSAIQKAFPALRQPDQQRPDYVGWTLNEDFIIWAHKMSYEEDLKGHPKHAYLPADDGTVQVRIEMEIH